MDLKTKYLGMTLKSPLMLAASPISESIENLKKVADRGAGAVVLYSLFEEQIRMEQRELHYHTIHGTERFAESLTYFPEMPEYKVGPEQYLEHIKKAKDAVNIPVIASLNGQTLGGWTDYAKKIEEAGADALELNIYYIPTDPNLDGEEIEKAYIDILKQVKSTVKIPVAMKLHPFFTNMSNMAKRCDEAGADGLVLFNRFQQPDINLAELEIRPKATLSHEVNIRLPLRWIAILKNNIKADLSATSGIHTGLDAIKMLMVGANTVQLCSALLKYGVEKFGEIHDDMERWLTDHEYESVEQMLGSMTREKVEDPSTFERAQYMKQITNYKFGQY
ncbi:MAG: dihydroorotate dehydrogenase-like protein [Candidatus Kapaibacterium sp.]